MKDHNHEEMYKDLGKIEGKLETLENTVKEKVSLSRFSPVEKVVYGLTSIILIFVLQYILNNIFK
jgi:cell division protein FtsL